MKRTALKLVAVGAVVAAALAACSSPSVNATSSSPPAVAPSDEPASPDAPDAPSDPATSPEAPDAAADEFVAQARAIVEQAGGTTEGFTPPSGGPEAQSPGATIAYVAADLTNGGINAVAEGTKEAAEAIGWSVTVLDGKASAQGRVEALNQAIAMKPAGIIVGGFDAAEQAATIATAIEQGIPVVAWHAGPVAGPMADEGIFTNVTTDAEEVSRIAAAYAVADSNGTAGVIIYTDRQYDIAVAKSDAIEQFINSCSGCSVLAYENSPIAEADSRMPSLVASELQQFGDQLTYFISINGNYAGGAQSALRAAGISGDGPPKFVAAGDGDAAEFQRIRNHDFQSATVAEPMNLQGWQLVDELNRAIAGQSPSGFVAKPGLVTADNVPAEGNFDPASGYRDIYRANWGK